MKRPIKFWGLLGGLVLLLACADSSSQARVKVNKADSPPCKQAYIEFHKAQDVLESASTALKSCAESNELNNDCAADFEAVKTAAQQFQWILREKLHPQCDEEK